MVNRLKHLTSHFGDVIKRKSNPSEVFVSNILSPRNIPLLSAASYGTEHDDRARNIHTVKIQKRLKHNIQVYESSLIMNPAYPYLGASPDRKVVDKSVEEPNGLLEINVHLNTETSAS